MKKRRSLHIKQSRLMTSLSQKKRCKCEPLLPFSSCMQFFFALLIFLLPFGASAGKKDPRPPVGSLINTSAASAPTIVLDPGHGGTDRGARSKAPFCEEKRICLQTARLVKKYLDQLGYHVVMTRTTDAFIPLPRRVEIASQSSSSVF